MYLYHNTKQLVLLLGLTWALDSSDLASLLWVNINSDILATELVSFPPSYRYIQAKIWGCLPLDIWNIYPVILFINHKARPTL